MSVEASRTLLEKFWIIKDREKDLYYKTKEGLDAARKFAREYPGWRLINNERVLKLEKIPAHAQPFMGITDFTDKTDYVLFCALLIFLEDREDGEPFLLSELTDMMEAQLKPVMELDWTSFSMRRSLIRVMQFATGQGLLLLHEGNVETVSADIHQEVLYENTGLSRFFAVNFSFDTSGYSGWQDFERENLSEADTDRGRFRINRVYRELLACPAMYWESAEDADSLYLKNQRQWVSKYLEENLEGRLDIHRNAAFFVLDEEDTFGEVFPGPAALYDIVLLVCGSLRELAVRSPVPGESEHEERSESETGSGETVLIADSVFAGLLDNMAEKFHNAWSKELREMAADKRRALIMDYMEDWMLLRREDGYVRIFPGAFKFSGHYPKDYDLSKPAESRSKAGADADTDTDEKTVRRQKRKRTAKTDQGTVDEPVKKKRKQVEEKGRQEQMDGQLSLF
ncbi:MAG: TIGR02678 family protein [Blautia sp.]|nr:TIGR02678 family protein [Blautia sp.]